MWSACMGGGGGLEISGYACCLFLSVSLYLSLPPFVIPLWLFPSFSPPVFFHMSLLSVSTLSLHISISPLYLSLSLPLWLSPSVYIYSHASPRCLYTFSLPFISPLGLSIYFYPMSLVYLSPLILSLSLLLCISTCLSFCLSFISLTLSLPSVSLLFFPSILSLYLSAPRPPSLCLFLLVSLLLCLFPLSLPSCLLFFSSSLFPFCILDHLTLSLCLFPFVSFPPSLLLSRPPLSLPSASSLCLFRYLPSVTPLSLLLSLSSASRCHLVWNSVYRKNHNFLNYRIYDKVRDNCETAIIVKAKKVAIIAITTSDRKR